MMPYNIRTPAACPSLVQVWRVPDCPELYQQLRPTFDELPAHFQSSRHYHLGIHASHPPMKLLRALQAAAHRRGGAAP
jgi:hypothetical protein